MLIGLFFAFCAMVFNSGAGLLQSDGTRRARKRRPLVLQPRYIGGLVVDGFGRVEGVVAGRQATSRGYP